MVLAGKYYHWLGENQRDDVTPGCIFVDHVCRQLGKCSMRFVSCCDLHVYSVCVVADGCDGCIPLSLSVYSCCKAPQKPRVSEQKKHIYIYVYIYIYTVVCSLHKYWPAYFLPTTVKVIDVFSYPYDSVMCVYI